jgi:hypothetical protein
MPSSGAAACSTKPTAVARLPADGPFRGPGLRMRSVRDPKGMAKLPGPERKEWQKLWGDVGELLTRGSRESPKQAK